MTLLDARPDVDLLDPTFHVGDPHPAYRWMRHHEPVYRDERNGLWCITRMEHLRHVERNADTFHSTSASVIRTSARLTYASVSITRPAPRADRARSSIRPSAPA